MFFRSFSKILAMATPLSTVITGAVVGLAYKVAPWQGRWTLLMAPALFLSLLGIFVGVAYLANPRLVRRFALDELNQEIEIVARELASGAIDGRELSLITKDDNLIKKEALRSVKKYLDLR